MSRDPNIVIEFAELSDRKYLVEWLSEPGVLRGFPMHDKREIEDSSKHWISYARYKAVLKALYKGKTAGLANIYLQPYRKLAHQCLLAIIVGEEFRGHGVGRALMEDLIKLAKEKFKIELLHLEVYEGNPAIHLYEKLGFERYGTQRRFIKDKGEYLNKILMQKSLI